MRTLSPRLGRAPAEGGSAKRRSAWILLPLLAAALWASACSCQPLAATTTAARTEVRPAAVAGQFYPAEPGRLQAAVKAFLADAVPARGTRPLALVAPHAGYVYSGQIAADAWRQAQGQACDVVVLLGTNHTMAGFRGAALSPAGGFRTPLGVAEVDARAAAALRAADPEVVENAAVHEREHSIEVQVPFAQVVQPGVPILPVVVSSEDPAFCARLGRGLAKALAGRRALIVASSDLSHYPGYDVARASDGTVLAAMTRLDPVALHGAIAAQMTAGRPGLATCACGEGAVMTALEAAKALGARRGVVLSWANSGDTAVGDRARVVGYGAVMLDAGPGGPDTAALGALPRAGQPADEAAALTSADRRALLALARRTLERWFATGTLPLARGFSPAATRPQGAFVTLLERGQLRGCIGHMAEDLPLAQTVQSMALSAAFEDTRFPQLQPTELKDLEIEVSVLTPLRRVAGPRAVVIGRDGVQIRKAGRAAVFLPEVPVEQGWDLNALMENLCLKAGLPKDAWTSGAEFWTFRSIMFRESEMR